MAISLFTVATFVVVPIAVERPPLQLLFGFRQNTLMLMMIIAAVASTLRSTHFAKREALTVHFYAVGFLTSASTFFSFSG